MLLGKTRANVNSGEWHLMRHAVIGWGRFNHWFFWLPFAWQQPYGQQPPTSSMYVWSEAPISCNDHYVFWLKMVHHVVFCDKKKRIKTVCNNQVMRQGSNTVDRWVPVTCCCCLYPNLNQCLCTSQTLGTDVWHCPLLWQTRRIASWSGRQSCKDPTFLCVYFISDESLTVRQQHFLYGFNMGTCSQSLVVHMLRVHYSDDFLFFSFFPSI